MNKNYKTILAAGLTAGVLDILAAILVYAVILNIATAKSVLQSIASGIHGKEAYNGGWSTAILGLAIHFMIALIFAAIFVLLYPNLKKLIPNAVVLGILYGCLVWLIMNCLVVPFSAIGRWPKWNFGFTHLPLAVLILIVCVGLPISLITAKMYKVR